MQRRDSVAASLGLALVLLAGGLRADPNPKALSLFQKALQENSARNYGAALKMYFDAHKEDPEILALDDEGLLQNASVWLDEQLSNDDADVHAHFQMAELKMLQGLERQALGHYEKVVQLEPQSPLANLAKPLVQDLKARLSSQPTTITVGGGSSSSSGGSSGSSSRESELQGEVDRLQQELSRSKDQISSLQRQLNEAQQGGNAQAELDKLRSEFAAYKQEAEQWKLYKTLYFADPRNVSNLRNLSGS